MELDELKAKKEDLKRLWESELRQQKEDERLLNLEMKQKLQDKQRQRWKTEVEIPSKINVSENIDWRCKFMNLEKLIVEMNKKHEQDQVLIKNLEEQVKQGNCEKEKLKKQLFESKINWNIKFTQMQNDLEESQFKLNNITKEMNEYRNFFQTTTNNNKFASLNETNNKVFQVGPQNYCKTKSSYT